MIEHCSRVAVCRPYILKIHIKIVGFCQHTISKQSNRSRSGPSPGPIFITSRCSWPKIMLAEYLCNDRHSCFRLSNILWTTKDPVKIGSSHYCSRGIIILIVEYTAVFNHPAITLTNNSIVVRYRIAVQRDPKPRTT